MRTKSLDVCDYDTHYRASKDWLPAESDRSEGFAIHLTRLKLSGFRNHVETDINLAPGLVVFTGANGHGKSGLLEAVHMLSVGKSLRASNDREIVNHSIARDGGHVQALGVFSSGAESVRAQFDLRISPSSTENFNRLNVGSKEWRINGVKVPPVEFVGRANVVIFEAADLDLALGAAAVRRALSRHPHRAVRYGIRPSVAPFEPRARQSQRTVERFI